MIPFSIVLFSMALSRVLYLAGVAAAIAAGAVVASSPGVGIAGLAAAVALLVASARV